MDTELKTPLTQLPQNDENDTDLVNKILSQLDDSNTTDDAPMFEEQSEASPATAPAHVTQRWTEQSAWPSHKNSIAK